ncbi:MAG: hypothetical protein H0V97_01370 [Actinobacteria bacterium]|nr:hypothetical protein [Actinomycetota bacterium]
MEQPTDHRYCVRCGMALPVELLAPSHAKATRFFAGVKVGDKDPEAGFLRVSCYLKEQTFEAAEGTVTIPGRHVRFSIWEESEAQCALSIPETEARALAEFIGDELRRLAQPRCSTADSGEWSAPAQ